MAILGNSLFSIIPGSNNGGNHVLNHSLAAILNGSLDSSSRGGGKVFLLSNSTTCCLKKLTMLEFYAVLGAAKSKDLSCGRLHLRFQLMLREIIPRNGFCHL